MNAEPRFPSTDPARGHYESFYLRAVDPAAPRGIWLRHTVHQKPRQEQTASLWCCLFERGRPPRALKQTFAASALATGGGDYIRINLAALSPTRAKGAAAGLEGERAEWDLTLEPGDEAPLRHLPREWMYTAAVPRTKTESPHPSLRVSGTWTIGERSVTLDGWRGMMGHNWGAEHAERWLWLNALGFEDAPDAWLDLAVGRVKAGPLTTPWLGNGALCLDGVRHRLGGIERARSTKVAERPDGCQVILTGSGGLRVEARFDAPRDELVAWRYADPEGGEHHALNNSICAVELHVRLGRGAAPRVLRSAHTGVFELGMRETDHGVPVQPYADG